MMPDVKILDDLKTDRPDITPPLPAIARLIPLLFYLSLVGCILLTALFALRIREVTQQRDALREKERASKAALEETRKEVQTLEARAKRANDLLTWTESARPLQPVLVELGRTVSEDAALTELRITRNEENPNQLRLALRMNTTRVEDLDRLLAKLQSFGYRAYSPEQRFTRGEIDYQAMLIWQNPASAAQGASGTQQPAATEPGAP